MIEQVTLATPTLHDFETVGLIYEAALSPERWPEVLDRLVTSFGAGGGIIALLDSRFPEAAVTSNSSIYTEEDLREYQLEILPHDRVDIVLDAPAGRIVTDEDVWPNREDFYNSPVVQWRERRFGLPHAWGCNLNNGEGWKDAVLFQCGVNPWPVPSSTIAKFQLFFPHIARSLRLSRLRAIVEAKYRRLLGMLDIIEVGVVLVGNDSQILLCNDEAKRIAEEQGVYSLGRGHMTAHHASEDVRLQELIRCAILESVDAVNSEKNTCTLRSRDGTAKCLIDVLPFRDGEQIRGAFIFCMDPGRRTSFKVDGIEDLYELTPAETDVCRLIAEGLTNSEIAESRGVKPETVKDQVATVFSKTGRRNRLDLLRLLVKINPPVKR